MSQHDVDTAGPELRQLRKAVEASGEVIFLTNGDGLITYVNPEFERLYGYRAEEVVGKHTPRLLKSALTDPACYAELWQQLRSQSVVRHEFMNLTRAGRLVVVDATINPLADEAGQLIGFVAIQRDITARKATEDALRESEARYRSLYDSMAEGVALHELMLDEHGTAVDYRILDVNPAFERIFNLPRDKAIGALASELTGTSPPRHLETYATVVATGGRASFETRYAPAGRTLRVSVFSPGPGRFATIFEDITEHRSLEDRLTHSQRMEAIGRLAGGIAHDFNNLLGAIIGYTELVLEQVDADAAVAEDLEEVRKAAETAAALTRQLLAFGRKQMLDARTVDLNELIESMEAMLRRIIGEDVRLSTRLDPALPPIHADPGQIQQIIMNLAVNARDAMPSGGALVIETATVQASDSACDEIARSAGRVVMLSVSDTGSGIDPAVKERIFEPFFTTKPVGHGTGLGLSTVYGIVRQSGGLVTVESEPGQGARFQICLPAVAGAGAERTTAPRAAHACGTETILLVEDEDGIRRLAGRVLKAHGYLVLDAENADDALALCERYEAPIDLLLTDVVMPGASGADLAREMKRRGRDVKTLYMSGYADQAVLAHVPIDNVHFLRKPFAPATLVMRVREALDAAEAGTPSPRVKS